MGPPIEACIAMTSKHRRRVLILDNYDSFTWNLAHAFGELGAEVEVVRADSGAAERLAGSDGTHVVISPGPGAPEDAAEARALIRATDGKRPLLGVCLGHQALAVEAGIPVRRLPQPVHGKTAVLKHTQAGLFSGLAGPVPVARYHSLFVDRNDVCDAFAVDAWCQDEPRVVMALRSLKNPTFGVQFHPESFLTDQGAAILSAFLE